MEDAHIRVQMPGLRQRSSILLLRIDPAFVPSCRHCQSLRMTRLISKVVVLRSEESGL